MKKRLLIVLCIVMSVTIFAETLTFAIGDWAPYTSQNDPSGKMTEVIVKEAYALAGYDVNYVYMPWKRSYEMAQSGEYAGTFPWSYKDERKDDFIFCKESLITSKEVIFHLKNLDLQWDKIEDLEKYTLGGTRGYSHVLVFKNHGIEIDIANDDLSNFKKLLKGRIQAFPADFVVGYNIINKNFPTESAALFTNHPKAISGEENMWMLISKNIPNSQEIAKKFDESLKKLKDSGRYQEIVDEFMKTK